MSDLNDTERLHGLEMGDLDESYRPASHLHVPKEAVEHYNEQGFDLRWVAIYSSPDRGSYNVKNITKKENEGYTFVKRDEIPGLSNALSSFFGEQLAAGDHGLYVIGEMALAKIPHSKIEARTRFLEDMTRAKSRAIIEDLRKNDVLPNKNRGEEFKTERSKVTLPSSRKVSLGKAAKAKVAKTNDSE